MRNQDSTTNSSNVVTVVGSSRGRGKSPFLRENSNRTAPHTSPSMYTRDLFKRSDKAVAGLKNGHFRSANQEA
ncbi:hypothetical protein C2I17_17430 [Niallia circulans]|uniref:hypothetical protein n=1 Tax=Niallia circulans TaxID=1397 RepID=UPI00201DDA81|nr:hypothetical protein [Niallia circulans]UQZ76196.1 hypothetical protein C2I17_17430 [Niallia circulans]